MERDRCYQESTAGGERLVKPAGGEMVWRNQESSAGGETLETRRAVPLKRDRHNQENSASGERPGGQAPKGGSIVAQKSSSVTATHRIAISL